MAWPVLKIHQIEPSNETWAGMGAFPDRIIYQSQEWMEFVALTQGANPVWGEVRDVASVVGYFSGLTFRKLGVPILGSPFPGWSTMFMGFNLQPEVPRWMALKALEKFAFDDLGCMHFEIADRFLTTLDADQAGMTYGLIETFETDLNQSYDDIFMGMKSACRRCIRKAEKTGLQIEQADDDDFATEYFEQLKEVFLKAGQIPTYDLNRVQTLIQKLGPTNRLLLLRARDPEGKCIATGIYPAMNKLAQFWGNASFRSGLHFRPNEALHWFAMRYWKQSGMDTFDWGGGGEYKAKYGCRKVQFPWIRKSKFSILDNMRSRAQDLISIKNRMQGWARGRSKAP